MPEQLRRDFFDRSVHEVAPELLGATLLVAGVVGRIVEVEAYDETDPARHAFTGKPVRLRSGTSRRVRSRRSSASASPSFPAAWSPSSARS